MLHRLSAISAVLLLASVLFAACTPAVQKPTETKKEPKQQKEKVKPKQKPKPNNDIAPGEQENQEIRRLLKQSNFDGALTKMTSSGGTVDPGKFGDLYLSALNGLIRQGESSMGRGDYQKAGIAFKKVLDNYPRDPAMQGPVERSAQDLRKNIASCSDILMEAGLRQYRLGELDEAITIWDGILVFDPDNAAARKARDTAVTQRQNLKMLQ